MLMGASVNRIDSRVFLGSEQPEVIDTRFGKIALRKDSPIIFPRGLLGIPDKFHFFLTEFPSEKLRNFKLLQNLDDYALSFIILPVSITNGIIAADDLRTACVDLGIKPENLATLLIVSVHRSVSGGSLSVNARAPLLVDSSAKLAAQYVFPTDKYKVQHPILM